MGLVRVPMTYKSVMGALGQGFSPPIPMVLLNVVVVGVCFAASVGVEKPSLLPGDSSPPSIEKLSRLSASAASGVFFATCFFAETCAHGESACVYVSGD